MADLVAPNRFMRIVDRRADPPGRGAVNRERFVRRFKEEIKRAADEEFARRSIKDIGRGGRISIPGRGLREPYLRHDEQTGSRDFVLPGNREFLPGDKIRRPDGGGSGGPAGEEPGRGEGRDEFAFVLSRDEFLSLFFDDLELPNLERTRFGEVTQERTRRAGYSRDGAPGNLAPARTVRMSIARRIALRGAINERIAELQEERQRADAERIAAIDWEIAELMRRRASLPFLEDIDRRYRARAPMPAPATRAVMLCLMDVSGSMDEHKKDLAKRFFALLYLFLERKYGAVDVVFVRHTEKAEEVDEQTFFHDQQTGGTLVLPALQLAHRIIEERYSGEQWNVYIAQASDGDCGLEDGRQSAAFVAEVLLPRVRYFAYIDIPSASGWFLRPSDLWQSYESIRSPSFACRQVRARSDIWPVFRELFARKEAGA
ncbi:MAG: YeaH/YhbH family protein [Sutterellaceae bacterium]|nr:YeaH/YhbH family protein [Burkholderiaceae bacterium]MCX7901276.1 YeaH/YhbH family protein [Burkholderiaceae bacterium]MDW8429426.1 YeaH/YhbH family protein [Sutterellaceae bacterium]